MLTNIELFNYSKDNPEELLDPYYAKNKIVIPATKDEDNELTANNKKLLDLITTFSVLYGNYHKEFMDDTVQGVIGDIIAILDRTEYINYSAFVQFFMVHNFTYAIYQTLNLDDKKYLIYEMLKKYCSERHGLYSNHGYSNIVLQVMCDNYSHKRNSKTSIEKVLGFLNTDKHPINRLRTSEELIQKDDYYFLPDKGDKRIFDSMLRELNIKMESRGIEHDKLPDIVFKHNGHYYICELKTMKGEGGGQNKQIVEIAYFIKFTEDTPNVHYIAFLDCDYSNVFFHDRSPKVIAQRKDIIKALHNNPGNYFLNTAGLIEFIKEVYAE
ncbi:MAG: hypothetical protein IKP24_00140 [Alphaproteobacteria bacterium]|nr:hypothetical protein [Alphaproteobacteria bacterium]